MLDDAYWKPVGSAAIHFCGKALRQLLLQLAASGEAKAQLGMGTQQQHQLSQRQPNTQNRLGTYHRRSFALQEHTTVALVVLVCSTITARLEQMNIY